MSSTPAFPICSVALYDIRISSPANGAEALLGRAPGRGLILRPGFFFLLYIFPFASFFHIQPLLPFILHKGTLFAGQKPAHLLPATVLRGAARPHNQPQNIISARHDDCVWPKAANAGPGLSTLHLYSIFPPGRALVFLSGLHPLSWD